MTTTERLPERDLIAACAKKVMGWTYVPEGNTLPREGNYPPVAWPAYWSTGTGKAVSKHWSPLRSDKTAEIVLNRALKNLRVAVGQPIDVVGEDQEGWGGFLVCETAPELVEHLEHQGKSKRRVQAELALKIQDEVDRRRRW